MIASRRSLRAVEEYKPPLEGRRGKVRLDFNENTTGFPWAAPGFDQESVSAYPEYSAAKSAVSRILGTPQDNFLLVNGSGEAIFLAAFSFIEPGEHRAVTSSPTFALIPHSLRIVGAELIEVPATPELEFDVPALEAALDSGARVAVFASPDNPTGAVLNDGVVESWLHKYPDTLFVIDEAYFGFCERTVLPLALEHDNLLVLRTFSKAYALAGLRMGAAVGHPSLIREIAKARCPYSVNAAASAAAVAAADRADEVAASCRETMRLKDMLVAEVARRGFSTHAGSANFFMFDAGIDAAVVCEFCRERGVLLRDRSSMRGLRGMVRVTVGTREQNSALLACLDEFRSKRAVVFDMDGTLIETSLSYDETVHRLVKAFSGSECAKGELASLRLEGGFNDDWDATVELLKRRGFEVPRRSIETQGKAIYLEIAKAAERPLVDFGALRRLSLRYRLFVYTGRTRDEFEPVWGDEFSGLFEAVYCRGDFKDALPKPAPDGLLLMMERHGFESGFYVGDSVDDMRAAAGAGLVPVGIATGEKPAKMIEAGAAIVVDGAVRISEITGQRLPESRR